VEMTLEERKEFEAFKERKEFEARKVREKENREAYKQLVDDAVNSVFPELQEVSSALAEKKKAVI